MRSVPLTFLAAVSLGFAVFRRGLVGKWRSFVESESRYRSLVDNMPGVVYRCANDEFWTMEFISERIVEITGYPASDFIENRVRTFASVILPEDHAHVIRVVGEAIAASKAFSLDYRIVHLDGSIRFIHENGVPLFDDQGRVRFLEGVVFDVTERRRTADLLAAQQAKLVASARLSSLGEMAGGIAHEINNPLAIISGRASQLQTLAESGELDPQVILAIATNIEATANRISKIVRALRHVARDSELDPFEVVSIGAILDETLDLCSEKMRHHGVDLQVVNDAPEMTLECRSVQIVQILINLLNNSYDAVMARSDDRRIEIHVTQTTGWIVLAVTDSGPGIPDELQEKVFAPFFTTKGVGRGTGLGLSISKSLAEDHAGELLLDQQDGRTRFVLRLPVQQGAHVHEGVTGITDPRDSSPL